MTALAIMVNATFRDRNLASDAIYRPGGAGAGTNCRAVLSAPDQGGNFGDTRFVTDTVILSLRVADAPTPAALDTVQIDGVVYRIQGAPTRDATRLVWTAEARQL